MERLPGKLAAELITRKRQTKPVHSLMDRTVFGKNELGVPSEADFSNWRGIIRHMEAAEPHRLKTTKVLSGRVSPTVLINQVADHAGEDTFMESLLGDRDQIAQFYGLLTPSAVEQTPASYQTLANSVILNERSPGALIHELGHAIDMNRGENESKLRRLLRWKFKPKLLAELDAWKKGQRAYREGFAKSPDSYKLESILQYTDNARSVNDRKYPALGGYIGGPLGALTGVAAGGIGGILAADRLMEGMRLSGREGNLLARLVLAGAMLGGTVGGLGGTVAGTQLGKLVSKVKSRNVVRKELSRLQKLREQYAREQQSPQRAVA